MVACLPRSRLVESLPQGEVLLLEHLHHCGVRFEQIAQSREFLAQIFVIRVSEPLVPLVTDGCLEFFLASSHSPELCVERGQGRCLDKYPFGGCKSEQGGRDGRSLSHSGRVCPHHDADEEEPGSNRKK